MKNKTDVLELQDSYDDALGNCRFFKDALKAHKDQIEVLKKKLSENEQIAEDCVLKAKDLGIHLL